MAAGGRIAVGQAELGAPGFQRFGAIVFGLPDPTRKNLRMLGTRARLLYSAS
jgi:hypothetical protein